jgi:tetratricopeptide (TPR) repeat protein
MCFALLRSLMKNPRYQNERGRTKESDEFFNTARRVFSFSTHPDRDSQLANIYFCQGGSAMNTDDFDKSRDYKERTFDLVSKICNKSQAADERLCLAYAERAISRIQDKRYEEDEADLEKVLRIRKNLGNCDPRSMKSIWGGRFF